MWKDQIPGRDEPEVLWKGVRRDVLRVKLYSPRLHRQSIDGGSSRKIERCASWFRPLQSYPNISLTLPSNVRLWGLFSTGVTCSHSCNNSRCRLLILLGV